MSRTRLHRRDLFFAGLLGLTLLCIAGFLFSQLGQPGSAAGGWRRIDLERLEMRLESGELLRREADWYAPVQR